jgi:hypothetical protein
MRTWRTPLIWCVSFIACFSTGIAIILACGAEIDPYDYYVSFFHNDVQHQKEYRPFYYTSALYVYDETEPASEAEINAEEWSAYLGKEVSVADVLKAMYHLTPKADSLLQEGYLKTGEKLPDSLANNSFLKALKRNSQAFKYYRFVKGVEKVANVAFDYWNPKPLDTIALRVAGNAALKTALLEKDKFIQLRYYYQAQRLLHYGRAYSDALKIYNRYLALTSSKSHIKGWSLALKAGELRHLKDSVQSAYLFSKIFAQYPERRIQAYINYKYLRGNHAAVIAMAANNSEKAVVYAMEAFGNTDNNLQPLDKVYELEPTSPMVGLLLTRELNKLEEQFLTPYLYKKNRVITADQYSKADADKDITLRNYMNKLSAFCKLIVKEHKYPDYNMGTLAIAYMAWMQGDNAGGFDQLRTLNSETLTPAMNDQKQIIQLLLSAQSIQKLNEVNEGQLLPALKWLDTKVKAEASKPNPNDYNYYDNHKFSNTARDFYQQILAPAYFRQGDSTKAALALLKSDAGYSVTDFWQNNLHSIQVARMIRWKKVPPTVPYLNFLTGKLADLKLNYLYELLGTAYLREHQYAKAIAALKQVDPVELNKSPEDYYKGDPFIDRINDYPKVMRYGKTKGFNKLQFADAMNDLEQKIKTDAPNAPSYYYRYATGLYNTSHYGNAWYLISYSWSSMDFGREYRYSYDADYIKAKNAEKYYLLARSLSSNEEFKAKCTFMAAKCHQKQIVNPDYGMANYDTLAKNYMLQIKSSDYFTELKTKYRKTAIFKKAVGECSYLKDFVLMSK